MNQKRRSAFINSKMVNALRRKSKSQMPALVVLVLDASGSMGSAPIRFPRGHQCRREPARGTNFSIRFLTGSTAEPPLRLIGQRSSTRSRCISHRYRVDPNRRDVPVDATLPPSIRRAKCHCQRDDSSAVHRRTRRTYRRWRNRPMQRQDMDEVVARASDVANPVNFYSIGLTGGFSIAEANCARISDPQMAGGIR